MPNRLADETSPYLRQHADNPVDWYPWGDEAFAAARERDVPIFLSVGYSACHWCHVMAHESFEDDETAALLNERFVSIKVDREERPDVDAIYMEAVQALSGRGGWPMTVFMAADGRPFFGGTYYPKTGSRGHMTFTDLLSRVDEVWRTQRDELDTQADELTAALRTGIDLDPGDDLPGAELVNAALTQLAKQFDPEWGGFGHAPKFPQTMSLELVLRAYAHNGSVDALAVVTTSLDAMASGGIYDHLGGGFARYSTDEHWLVPHFEKMLYDQALLTRVYLHAWQVTGEPRYRQVLDETIGYVLRDLHHAAGGFYSAEDADSLDAAGHSGEGAFYTWSLDEVAEVLDDEGLLAAATEWWGITEDGNWEGRTIPWRPQRGDLLRSPEVEEARRRLFDARENRPRPGLDDKVLTEWNGLMLSSLAEAAAATGDADWLAAAVANAEFLLTHLRGEDGRWLRSWQADGDARVGNAMVDDNLAVGDNPTVDDNQVVAGRAQHLAYAADHAALIDAFTRLGEATGQARWIAEARSVADALLELFTDDERGGFYTTGSDAPSLVVRPKDLLDNATPSANSQAALSLLRLGALTGETRYEEAAAGVLRLLGPMAAQHPTATAHLLAAVDLHLAGTTEVAIAGEGPDADALVAEVAQRFLPHTVLTWGEPFDSPLWEGRGPDAEGRPRAFVCRDFTCQAPVDTPEALRAELAAP